MCGSTVLLISFCIIPAFLLLFKDSSGSLLGYVVDIRPDLVHLPSTTSPPIRRPPTETTTKHQFQEVGAEVLQGKGQGYCSVGARGTAGLGPDLLQGKGQMYCKVGARGTAG